MMHIAPLSHDYVLNHTFKKLSDTFEKYRAILPDIEDVEHAYISTNKSYNLFEVTLYILDI